MAVCSSWGWGGTQKQVLRLCEELVRRGSQVDLVVRAIEPFRARRALDVPSLRLRRLPIRADGDLLTVAGLVWICLRRRADVLLVTQLPEYLLGGLAGKLARVPVLLRMGIDRTARGYSRSDRWRYARFPAALVVNAERIRDHLLETPWMRHKDITVVHNGVDAPGPMPADERTRAREDLGIPPSATVVLGVGRFVGDKRFEWLVDATADLLARGHDIITVLVGGGEEGPVLEARVTERNLGGRFRFVGFRDEIEHWIGLADVVALPSVREGMPNVVLESLGRGRAVVATRVGGLGELIRSGEHALLSDVDEYEGFVGNLDRAVGDTGLRHRLGRAGLDVVRANHGWGRMVDEIEPIIDRVARR